jgi:undecaprenyl diphosphate synthase
MLERINKDNLPEHIAIIMDGNGRWARKKGAARIFGHNNAIQSVRDTVEGCAELGVKYLTLYAFSTENWGRPKNEVEGLMSLLVKTLKNEVGELNKNNVRLDAIGDTEQLPGICNRELKEAIELTSANTGLTVILALNYSGRWEITQAMRLIAEDIRKGILDVNNINQDTISFYLETHGIPDPELMIRTSGEMRISNFLLWQLAYTELYVTEVLWPDFRKKDLLAAIADFQKRERRFGKVVEKV